jgi:hypothetical protein
MFFPLGIICAHIKSLLIQYVANLQRLLPKWAWNQAYALAGVHKQGYRG